MNKPVDRKEIADFSKKYQQQRKQSIDDANKKREALVKEIEKTNRAVLPNYSDADKKQARKGVANRGEDLVQARRANRK